MDNESHIYKTITVIITGFLILQLIFGQIIFIYIALSIGLLSLISERIGKGIHFVWYKIAEGLGWVNSRIILGIVFYIFLFPIAILARLFRKNDELFIKKPANKSLFVSRNHQFKKEDLENIW